MRLARPLTTLGIALLLVLACEQARADEVIETRDGRTFTGRVVSESETAIVLELRSGSVSGTVTIPRGEVRSRRSEGGADPRAGDRARRAAEARALRDPGERARALLRLAEQVEAEGAPEDAAALFEEAGAADPELRDETDVDAANAYLAANREVEAARVLSAAIARNPRNAQALALSRRLEAAFAAKAAQLIDPGVRAFLDNDPRRALRLLAQATEELPRDVVDAASARVREQTGLTIAQIMVDCRMRAPCRTCDGAGVVACPLASATTSTRCRFGHRFHNTRVEEVGELRVARMERCGRCDGAGHLTCEDCFGLGLAIGRPTEYEREELVATLGGTLQRLEGQVGTLTGRTEDGAAPDPLRAVACTELLTVLQQLRAMTRVVARLDPRQAAIGGGDLRRSEQQATRRMATVMNALANALFVAGEQRYEDAVSGSSAQDEEGEQVPVALRAVRARQAWEAVNQARIFTTEALNLDPSTAGPLGGDLRRRLHLMEQFLSRTWRTYVRLRAAEEGMQNEPLEELMRQAVETAVQQAADPSLGAGGQ